MYSVTMDWLSQLEPVQPVPYWFTDRRLYAGLNSSRFEDKLDWKQFEEYMNLPPAPEKPAEELLKPSISRPGDSVFPIYSSGHELAPFIGIKETTTKENANLPIDREQLSYLIRRLSAFDHNKSPQQYLHQAPGLDLVTRGIFALHEYAKFCGEKLQWQSTIQNLIFINRMTDIKYSDFARTKWSRCDLLPDAAAEYEDKPLLQEVRHSFVSLNHPVILKICETIWKSQEHTSITYSFIRNKIGCSKRKSSRFAEEMAVFMTERMLPEISKLGLRYRVLVTPLIRPRVWNAGLTQAYEIANSEYRGFFVYTEPRDCIGPKKSDLQEGSFHFTATEGVLSYRLDLWKEGKWLFEPWKLKPEAIDGKEDRWFLIEFNMEEDVIEISPREAAILGVLSSHQGDVTSRRALLELLGIPSRSARHYQKQLEQKGALNACQYPKLCFSGLTDGAILVVPSSKKMEAIRKHLLSIVPYCEIYANERTGSLWAIMRIPRWRFDLLKGVLTEFLDRHHIEYQLGRMVEENCYRMTLPSRLHEESSGVFADPWA